MTSRQQIPQNASLQHLHVSGNLFLKGVKVVSPLNGQNVSLNIETGSPGIIVAPSSPIDSNVNIVFPNLVSDGQLLFISFTQDMQNVTFSNANFANKSVLGPIVSAGDSVMLFYNGASSKWYKISGGNV